MSELVRVLEGIRAGVEDGTIPSVTYTSDLDRAINLAKQQSSREATAAAALQGAARLLDRMRRLGKTPYNELTDRQREEYAKFISYGEDTPRWLRDISAKPGKLLPGREYGVAVRHQGYKRWMMPRDGETGTRRDAAREYASLQQHSALKTGVTTAKIVSRQKAGEWEDEDS